MKKLIVLLPLSILMMASCSNDEQTSSMSKKEISVRPLVQYSTRGEAVTLANLDAFRVYGTNVDAANPAIEADFVDIVTPEADGSTWSMQDVHYWMTDPVSGTPNYGANVVNFNRELQAGIHLVAVQHALDVIDHAALADEGAHVHPLEFLVGDGEDDGVELSGRNLPDVQKICQNRKIFFALLTKRIYNTTQIFLAGGKSAT